MKGSNIYLRKDGRLEGRITIGNDNGKRKYKAFFGKTIDEVSQKMAKFRRNLSISSLKANKTPVSQIAILRTF